MHKKLAAAFILFFMIVCVISVPANCKIPSLQACQKIDSDRPPDDPFPKDYQIAVKAHLRETLNDPYQAVAEVAILIMRGSVVTATTRTANPSGDATTRMIATASSV